MTNYELNALVGREFSIDEYAVIDSAYLRSSKEKEEFCFGLKNMYVAAPDVFDELISSFVSDSQEGNVYNKACELIDYSVEHDDACAARAAVKLIGIVQFLAYKVKKGYHLYRKDRDELLDIVGRDRLIEILDNLGQSDSSLCY